MKVTRFALILAVLLSTAAIKAGAADKDIIDTAVAAGSFNTLATALQAADLIDALKGEGPFTVFAPTDDAFKKLPAGTLESLLKPENKEKLRAILTYHVVSGRVTAAQAMKLSSAKTLNGQNVTISTHDGTLMVNKAKVTKADISASNGVIHVIDAVILPGSN
jgi:transforming growth factor-beta-induced protein